MIFDEPVTMGNANHCVHHSPFFNSAAGFTSGSVRLMTRSRLKSQYQPRDKVNRNKESQMSQERMSGILRANNGTGKLDSLADPPCHHAP